jgi:hypothetical protein
MDTKKLCVAAFVVVAVLAVVRTTQATNTASLRTLKGTYGLSGSGTLLGGTVQAAIVGVNAFDRAGGCAIRARINAFGSVTPVNSTSCSYTVRADGTGVLQVTFDNPLFAGPFRSDFVIVDNAKELRFMLSDPSGGTVATGVAKRQTSDDSNE